MAAHTMSAGAVRPRAFSFSTRHFFTGAPVKISWGAIAAGVVSALGLWALLYTLGLALGLSTVTPENAATAKASGIFAGIWGLVSPLVALFFGGFVAARSAGIYDRGAGAIHGFVLWGATLLLGAFMVGSLVSSVVGGVASLGKSVVQAGGSAAANLAEDTKPGEALGVRADDLLGPINQRLEAEGKPAVTAEQLSAAGKSALQQSVTNGKVDRQTLVSSITESTELSEADANDLAGRLEAQLNAGKQTVATGALKAADATGKVFWGIFAALALGLVSALIGGSVGVASRTAVAP
ncbi:MAG: hypothetical protein JNK82_13770 [Myxococcaceae bacterium]|nr:hypothetical protein [Myxococcaceae bacterium]